MTIKEKKAEIEKRIAELENDKFRLQTLIPTSTSDTLKARMDHLERIIYELREAYKSEEIYSRHSDTDEIICDIKDGELITLSNDECELIHEENQFQDFIQLQQAIKDEIELGESDYYRERNR